MSTLFVDESKTGTYTVVAVLVAPSDVQRYDRSIDQLRMRGQRRVHFVAESPSRRRQIPSELERRGVRARAYRADGSDVAARQACLDAFIADLTPATSRIVLEQDDSTVQADRQQLYRGLRTLGRTEVTYQHARAVDAPLLALPDALVWCIAQGGDWRRRVEPMLTVVQTLSG